MLQEQHLIGDDASKTNESNQLLAISYELSSIPLEIESLASVQLSESGKTLSPVDSVTLKAFNSNITLIRNKRMDNNEPSKIAEKHKNYFECDQCKSGFSMFVERL